MKKSEISIVDSSIDKSVQIIEPVNIYGATIKKGCFIGPFVEIQHSVIIDEKSRISSHCFLCSGVNIGKEVFIAHGVMFTNDLFKSNHYKSWDLCETYIEDNVRIGSGAVILPVRIGKGSIIGAGAVVTKDVEPGSIMVGNPARKINKL